MVEAIDEPQEHDGFEDQTAGYETNPRSKSMYVTDGQIFSAEEQDNNSLFVNEKEKNYSVRDPDFSAGFTVYTVTGIDSQGAFEIKRRYNEFFLLQDALARRFPGVNVP